MKNVNLKQMKPNKGKRKMKLMRLLLLLPLFATNYAVAQTGGQEGHEGLYMYKDFKPENQFSNKGDLILRSFVTGEVTSQKVAVPCDIVLVVDQSGSMKNNSDMAKYTPRPEQNYTYNSYGYNSYYYLHTDGEYYQVYRDRDPSGTDPRVRFLYVTIGGTRYYLSGNNPVATIEHPASPTGQYDNIWKGVLYEQTMQTRLAALKDAAQLFVKQISDNAASEGVNHRVAIVGFSNKANNSFTGTELLSTQNKVTYSENGVTDTQYRDALVNANVDGSLNPRLTTAVDRIWANSSTYMQYGLDMADKILEKRREKTYTLPDGTEVPRSTIVVFFTDGACGRAALANDATWYYNRTTPNVQDQGITADEVITKANSIKEKGVTLFSIGIFGGADPTAAYRSTTSGSGDTQEWHYNVACSNGLMQFMSSNYGYWDEDHTVFTPEVTSFTGRTTSTYTTTSSANTANNAHAQKGFYMAASNSDELTKVFTKISSQISSDVYDLGTETIVQDVVSEYFVLPEGTTVDDIKVTVANCTGGDDASGWVFDEDHATTDANIEVTLGEDNKTVSVTGFDFKQNYVAKIVDGSSTTWRGQELIISFPIEAVPDLWGDQFPTNTTTSVIWPNGPTGGSPIPFPVPVHTLKRHTWVEYVTEDPGTNAISIETNDGVRTAHIKSKEGLAWFISLVTGYNGQDPDPELNALLEADVDMSSLNWVSIGGNEGYYKETGTSGVYEFVYGTSHAGYTGQFDGQGHTIRGLRNQASVVIQPGMFGRVHGEGAEVKNTFIMDCDFITCKEGYFGIIADTISDGAVVYNCEASGLLRTHATNPYDADPVIYKDMSYDPQKAHLGGLVGLVGRHDNFVNPGDDAFAVNAPAEVHSCISVADIKGYDMGGAVAEIAGEDAAGNSSYLRNTFSYPTFCHWQPTVGSAVGGLVAVNYGKVENCYLRERAVEGEQLGVKDILDNLVMDAKKGLRGTAYLGLLVGNNDGSVSYCYLPEEIITSHPLTSKGNVVGLTEIAKFTETETPYMYKHADNSVTMFTASKAATYLKEEWPGMLNSLNAWVEAANGTGSKYTKWFRTTADGINNDYPVLKIMDFEAVGSDDQIRLYYGGVNDLIKTGGRMFHNDYAENTLDKSDDFVCLYQNTENVVSNVATLYINEDVAMTHADGATVTAYVGITLDNSAGESGAMSGHPTQPNPDDEIDWHMFSTSLSNAPLGINYTDYNVHNFSYDAEQNPDYYFFSENDKDGYFPSIEYHAGNYNADWDFYTFEEKYHHWMNFKRNSKSHWDEDPNTGHANLPYSNDNSSTLEVGKGYLLAIANETFFQSHGTLNNGGITYLASYTSNPFTMGYNLIGNPYQSYLDFSKFVETNSTIDSYVILDEDARGYVTVAATGSDNTYPEGYVAPGNMIHMHQGFFVHVDGSTTINFNNGMRSIDKTSEPYFRGSKHNYPLVNLVVKEENGNREYLTVETNRPSVGGAKKLNGLRSGNSQMYAHADNNDYAILFATEDMNEVPVRFTTDADATYTMIWNTQNGEFTKLQLIDNIAGVTVDMLASDEYTFTSKTTDFESRFRLVFHAIGDDEDDDEAETEDGDFAFFDGSNLVVSGTGMLSVCDINGRVIYSANLNGTQSSVSMPDMARGLYLLRLTNSASTKVQKIVIRK